MLSSRYVLRVTLAALASVGFADANDLLIAAIGKGDLERVRDLIATGADPNADASGGASVLALASARGHREIAALLLERGALVQGVANASGVRIRDRATTVGSAIIGSSDQGELVSILARSRERVAIQGMVAHWYRIQKADSTTGFSYGFFFDVDAREIDVLPMFYENDRYGFRLQIPATWEGFVVSEQLIDFGSGVEAPVIYFGLAAQSEIFALGILTHAQWEALSKVDGRDGITGPPLAENDRFRFRYSLGHYAANDEMHRRRAEVPAVARTLEAFAPAP